MDGCDYIWRFFPSYLKAAEAMDEERAGRFLMALARYGCEGIEPDFGGDGWLESAFEAARPNLDRSIEACANGRRGGRGRRKSEPVENVENPVENPGPGSSMGKSDDDNLNMNEKDPLNPSLNPPLNPAENQRERERERDQVREKEIAGHQDQTGDGPGSCNGPATPSLEEVRAEAARSGYMWADLDAFAESLRAMPPGTDWKLELAKTDMAAWGEANGMEMADVGEVV